MTVSLAVNHGREQGLGSPSAEGTDSPLIDVHCTLLKFFDPFDFLGFLL